MVLGLRANWRQFALLVAITAFVGAMVGLERAVIPVMAQREFQLSSATLVLSFIVAFGLTKALTNLAAGWIADRGARRPVLLLGWLLALPIPALILFAPNWGWIVAANALLGIQQGLTWSTTVIMKIDLVGPARRGLAMGLNEFAGYVAVGVSGLVCAALATSLGPREAAAAVGATVALVGLALSLLARETAAHAREEVRNGASVPPRLGTVIRQSLWSHAGLFSVSQAGLVNNLNDGLVWGLFPLLFMQAGFGLRTAGVLAAVYPVTWGLAQLLTGLLSDWWGRKPLIVAGMLLQGLALVVAARVAAVVPWSLALVALGIGTALVYPTLLAAVGDLSDPSWRGSAVGVYRMWRDFGYVAGALLAGVLTDGFGPATAIVAVGLLTACSGIVVALRFQESRR